MYMKKLVLLLSFLVLLSSTVLADYGMMDGYGMMGGAGMLGGLLGLVYFALAAFVFSVIFWMTHNWLVKKKR
jgi:hypothetical protein